MKNLHCEPFTCQGVPLPKHLLAIASRLGEDLNAAQAKRVARELGGDVDSILQSGYFTATAPFCRFFQTHGYTLPSFVRARRTIILICRDERGEIVGLHDEAKRWIVGPVPHVANPRRARYEPVRIYSTVAEADSQSLKLNVCAVASNGVPILDLLQRLNRANAGGRAAA